MTDVDLMRRLSHGPEAMIDQIAAASLSSGTTNWPTLPPVV